MSTMTAAEIGAGWARERLWLGMSNVGFWVVVAVAALIAGVPPLGLGDADGVVWLGAALVLQAPFDLVGGYLLQHRHGRGGRPLGSFLVSWSRAVVVQAVVVLITGTAALVLSDLGGDALVWLGAVLVMAVFLGLQRPWMRLLAGLKARPLTPREQARAQSAGLDASRVRVVAARDPGFVGGWLGWPGAEVLVIPDAWHETLSEVGWDTQLARRAVTRRSGQRRRGALLALGWNAVGFGLGLALHGAGDVAGLVGTIAVFTLWSFLSVLVLPTVSRLGVYAVDRATVASGVPVEDLVRTVRELDRLQDDEPDRTELVETIFHPVPAVDNRVSALHGAPASSGAWHAARMALLLGVPLASPLSRAVHCNIGRPELWAVYPGD